LGQSHVDGGGASAENDGSIECPLAHQ